MLQTTSNELITISGVIYFSKNLTMHCISKDSLMQVFLISAISNFHFPITQETCLKILYNKMIFFLFSLSKVIKKQKIKSNFYFLFFREKNAPNKFHIVAQETYGFEVNHMSKNAVYSTKSHVLYVQCITVYVHYFDLFQAYFK